MFRAINARSLLQKTFRTQFLQNNFNGNFGYHDNKIRVIENTLIPLFSTKFRHNYSPYYWKLKDECYEPILNLYDGKEKMDALISMKSFGLADLLACFCWPLTVSEKRMLTLNRFYCFTFLEDDCIGTDLSGDGITDLGEVILGKKKPEKSLEFLISEVTNEISSYYTTKQMQRFIPLLFKIPGDHIKEIDNQYNEIKSFEDLIEMRFYVVGVPVSLDLIQLSMGIDISEYVDNAILIRLEWLSTKHPILINDTYSMKKEVARRLSQKPYNTLLYLYGNTNDLIGSVKRIHQLIEDIENEFFECKNTLLKEYPRSTDLHKYIDGLEYWCGGNVIWTSFCPRYNNYNKYSLDFVLKHTFNYSQLISVVNETVAQKQVIES